MKLDIPERIALLSILPVEGSILSLRVLKELRIDLAFTEEEIKDYGLSNHIMPEGGATITWNPEQTGTLKDVKIGDVAKSIIINKLKELDAMQKLHITMMPLYEKFVEKL